MNILLTGATGYIGKRLIPVLLEQGHTVYACVRDKTRFDKSLYRADNLKVLEANFLEKHTLSSIPNHIDTAYYLIHSMSASVKDFSVLERQTAENFVDYINNTQVKQVIYLSGIVNSQKLSKHLDSRLKVEQILNSGNYALTTLRAGIIVGSGSASFEIIRDLVEKLPVMVAPKWLNTLSQPIAIRNVVQYLTGVLNIPETYNKSFDIGGPEVLTYRQMLLQFAHVRNLKRFIYTVPVMTPRLSSYWLYFVTSTSYKLAINLVNSMKIEIICGNNNLQKILPIKLLSYKKAVQLAFDKIEQHAVLSSWTDALSSLTLAQGVSPLINVPNYGCFHDKRNRKIADAPATLERIWGIGGKTGWYYGNWLWAIRGFIDKLFGGVGLRRGRRSETMLAAGDALDFWRVLYANKQEGRLLLYAEMKLPGEAWLDFKITGNQLYQTATFRPLGLWGRLYWLSVLPFHAFIFNGLLKQLSK